MRAGPALKPIFMGTVMGLMMLGMVHQMLTGDQAMGRAALLAFVGVHLAVILGVAVAGIWAARFSPRLKRWLGKLHRPSMRHLASMLASGTAAALIVHLYLHGGV
ncbi:MAG: hypothetical protein WA782_04615 [Sulfitobacter sp.]